LVFPRVMQFETIDCIIKIGGSAITNKDKFETLNDDVLDQVTSMISDLHKAGIKMIVIHGAGSFGHFQASKFNVQNGGIGLCEIRRSVLKLCLLFTNKLVEAGVNAVSCPTFLFWETKTIDEEPLSVVKHNADMIEDLVKKGFVPLLHGDVVFDQTKNFTILSGDVITRVLAEVLKPKRVVHLSDIKGIYTAPPEKIGSELIKEIVVTKSGDFKMPETSKRDHDGIKLKLMESHLITMQGTSVYFAEAGSPSALQACLGKKPEEGTHMYLAST